MRIDLIIKAVGGVVVVLVSTAKWAKSTYQHMIRREIIQDQTAFFDIDTYVGQTPSSMECLQCILLLWFTQHTRNLNSKPYKLVAQESKDMKGLLVTRRAKANESPTDTSGGDKKKLPLVVGTIRMGFGHFRIAYGVSDWALDAVENAGRDVYFHDIVNINSDEGELVDQGETLYSLGSRIATEGPSFIEKMWGGATKSGGANALRAQCLAAAQLDSLMTDLDRNSPIISTHPLVGAIAVAAGFKNVVNLVVDNHAQWFVIVPGALNLVQGPSAYRELLELGVPEKDIELVGHWNPKHLVDDIPDAVQRRIARVNQKKPLRLLIPVGGAGAQQSLLTDLIRNLAPLVKQGMVQLFLNAADHVHIRKAFEKQLKESGLEYETVSDSQSLIAFKDYLLASQDNEPSKAVTLFAFTEKYPSVAGTDNLCHVADVLVCKPSEMAFYAVPKLHIRRVGDHEQKSAYRASELGDGTLEVRTVKGVIQKIQEFLSKPSILTNMNKAIQSNNQIGIYDGSKVAVDRALERAESMGV